MVFFSSIFYLLLSISFFISFRSLLGSILSSQTDLPTLKNVDFMKAGARFLKNHHFRSKDGFGNVLGLSRPHFGSSWGSLGVSWGLPRGPRASKIFDDLWLFKAEKETGAVWSLGPPRRAPRAPKMRPREPQNGSKTIFGSKMMIFQKSSSRFHRINIFEGRKVSLGARN